ncbi:hypothetical protein ACHAWT_007424 [Skeletonema menzelii]
MLLSAKMADAARTLGKALLTSLNVENSTVTPSSTSQPLSEVLPSGSHGSICFVLTDMATNNQELMNKFKMWGVVKETGVDDEGLSKFYNDYFTFPLFKDEGLALYNDFFGKRKVGLTTYNPFKLYKGYKEMTQRLNGKGLDGNMTGEGMIQGGLIIFDKEGNARYAYEEIIGDELEIDDIVAALEDVVKDEK